MSVILISSNNFDFQYLLLICNLSIKFTENDELSLSRLNGTLNTSKRFSGQQKLFIKLFYINYLCSRVLIDYFLILHFKHQKPSGKNFFEKTKFKNVLNISFHQIINKNMLCFLYFKTEFVKKVLKRAVKIVRCFICIY